MNQLKFLLMLCFSLGLLMACTGSKGISLKNKEIEKKYNDSRKKWTQLKKDHQDSYEYTMSQSSWVGWSAKTVIKVVNGKVISRAYYTNEREEGEGFQQEMRLIFEEDSSNINTNRAGEQAYTLDLLYENCGTKSLTVDEQTNNIYFETDDTGIMQQCGYFPKNCADDCSKGVYIASFEWLE